MRQLPPESDWHTWLILGGRGSGKTRMGAEWVNGMVHALPLFAGTKSCNIALVGETLADVREVMIDGPSGIMSVSRAERPRYEMTRRRLVWQSGATASMFSSEDPDSLRGPQFDAAWCDELGCPAVDKGPNQPNVFPDMKSSEGAFPHFSDNGRSDLAQNRYLRAHFAHWNTDHAGSMLDRDRLYVWAWDTRPYPEFPLKRKLWSDGDNWSAGHWLNGRVSGVALDELIAAILTDFGFSSFDTSAVDGFVSGYVIDEPASVRSAIEPLLALYGVDAFESGKRLIFQSAARMNARAPLIAEFVEPEKDGAITWRLQEMMEQPARVELGYRDPMLDYQAAMACSERLDGRGTETIAMPGTIDGGQAKALAEAWIQARRAARRTASFELSWKHADLRAGDRIRLAGGAETATPDFVVTSIEDGATRRIEARALPQHVRYPVHAGLPTALDSGKTAIRGRPYVHMIDLPLWPGVERPADQFRIVAFAKPWSGASAFASPEMAGFEPRANMSDCAVMGELTRPLDAGPSGRLLNDQTLNVRLYDGELRSVSLPQMLNGANTVLVGTQDGSWELLQFLAAEETGGNEWQLTGLLRGQSGTEPEALQSKAEGAPFILLDEAVVPAGLKPQEAGLELNWRIGASGEDFSDRFFTTGTKAGGLRAMRPLEPVHIRAAVQTNGDMLVSWIRRGRVDADSWLVPEIPLGEEREAYRIDIYQGQKPVRSSEVTGTRWVYSAVNRLADLGSSDAEFDFAVAMISAAVGPGQSARRRLSPNAF